MVAQMLVLPVIEGALFIPTPQDHQNLIFHRSEKETKGVDRRAVDQVVTTRLSREYRRGRGCYPSLSTSKLFYKTLIYLSRKN